MKSRSLLVTAAFLLPTAACSSTSDSPTPTVASSASSTETEPAYDGPTIPAGLFEKSITRKDVEKVGVEPQEIHFSPEGTALVVYKFAGGVWTQFSGPTEDQLDRGSDGTHHFDDDGNLVLSEACCGDSILTWSWDGTKLTMALETGDQPLLPIDHLMRDGIYTKTE